LGADVNPISGVNRVRWLANHEIIQGNSMGAWALVSQRKLLMLFE